ncbi:hypothetical protein RCOM_0561550 [Ricinus communis]|uniref:Uncharacterized protein n=1 Tax=Ricinus communis TaxID=3988 RepID=B9S2T2_RICCO|nr:hypothetical protein RCOM_0561550 [Ricinus communis]
MGGKRRNSRSSGRVYDEDEANDFVYDVRLARRWKRRCIANQDFNLNSCGKNRFNKSEANCDEAPTGIPESNPVKIDVDVVDTDVDSDYRTYLDSIDLEAIDDIDAVDHRNVDNGGDTGGDLALVVNDDTHHNDAIDDTDHQYGSKNVRIDINKEGDHVDASYEKWFVLEALLARNVGKCVSADTGDTGDPQYEAIHEHDIDENKEQFVDSDYEKFLALKPFVHCGVDRNSFFNNHSDVNTANGSVKIVSSGDELVENTSANDIDNNSNSNALGDMEPQSRKAPKSNIFNSSDDKMDVDNEKFIDGSALGPSGDAAVNAVNGSLETGNSGDKLVENESANGHINNNNVNALSDMDPQNNKIPESNNVKPHDDKLDVDNEKLFDGSALGPLGDSDVCYDWFADNISVDLDGLTQTAENNTRGIWSTENAAVAGGSVETRFASNDADHNDDLDDLQYKMFLKNLREEGKSYVLEVPVIDGISEIIKYETDDGSHDRFKAENPNRTRRSREAAVWSKHDYKHEMEFDIVDDSYKIFLKSLKKEGKHVVFTPESGAKVVYDEDEGSSSDSEVIVMDSDPFADKGYTPFVTSRSKVCDVLEEEDSQRIKGFPGNDCSWFRERVMKILRNPYDQKEYDKLLNEVYRHAPVTVDRDLRNGRSRRCSANLDRKIKSAGCNKPKVLNLLRGFFYWLQVHFLIHITAASFYPECGT